MKYSNIVQIIRKRTSISIYLFFASVAGCGRASVEALFGRFEVEKLYVVVVVPRPSFVEKSPFGDRS